MTKRDVDLLYEIGTLRFVPRTWQQFLRPDVANVAGHSFRVIWIALLLCKMEGVIEDKVLKMALMHDMAESRTGDVHYLSRLYTDRHEDKALQDMLNNSSLASKLIKIGHEMKAKTTVEAKIVKDADNLDVELELKELAARGHSLGTTWNEDRQREVRSRLFTDSAKKLWDQIHHTDPHHWHISANNRFTKGDWQTKDKNR